MQSFDGNRHSCFQPDFGLVDDMINELRFRVRLRLRFGPKTQRHVWIRPCLQNLHPRFKSGRRLQFLLKNLKIWIRRWRRIGLNFG